MLNLKGKIVFISGASSGIGAATARLFAAAGAKLILSARRIERLEMLRDSLQKTYQTAAQCLELDIRDLQAVTAAITGLPQDWQQIDLLVNNAGLAAGKDKLFEADIEDWERMIDTNIKGLLYLSRLIVPGMAERKQGHIINIGSIAGHEAYGGGSVYCGTKFAVRAISRALKIDLQGHGVRVSSVDPGAVETEFSIVRFHGDTTQAKAAYAGMTPLTAEDVADAVLYCATRPPHVNISEILLMPTDQATATNIHRRNN